MEEKLISCFSLVLNIDKDDVSSLSAESCENWDSVSHIMLIEELEQTFGIEFEAEDLFRLKSYSSIRSFVENNISKGGI